MRVECSGDQRGNQGELEQLPGRRAAGLCGRWIGPGHLRCGVVVGFCTVSLTHDPWSMRGVWCARTLRRATARPRLLSHHFKLIVCDCRRTVACVAKARALPFVDSIDVDPADRGHAPLGVAVRHWSPSPVASSPLPEAVA